MQETVERQKEIFDLLGGEGPSPEIPLKNLGAKRGRETVNQCTECGSKDVRRDYQRGEVVCSDCGLVVDENLIDQGAEWNAYDAVQREKRTRVGAPSSILIHDKGLGTTFNVSGRDARKRFPSQTEKLYRMKRMQRRARVGTAAERNVSFALGELERMGSALALKKSTRERAAYVYRDVVEDGFVRGRSIESVLSAVIYGVCKEVDTPRTFKEIADVARVSMRDIKTSYRELNKSKKLKIKRKLTSPADYVPRFVSDLKLPYEYAGYASRILEEAGERRILGGRVPAVRAAASIYLAWRLYGEESSPSRLTQDMVKKVTGVSEVSIRNAYKEMAEGLGLSEFVGDKIEESN